MITPPFPLRILVHSEVVGAIIGLSGSTIRNITQQTKARIDVHREEIPDQHEKVITINGTPDSCSEACLKIIQVVQAELNAKCDAPPARNRDITLKILASSTLIGRLIGRSGSSIRMMMEQTSTRINISTNSTTETTGEHTIFVIGKLEQVMQAERLISAKLRAAFEYDMNTSLQTMGQQPYLFNNVLLPYMPSPYQQNSILASIVSPQSGHGGNSMPRQMPLSTPHHGQMSNSLYTAPGYLPIYSNPNATPGASSLMGYNPVAPGFEQERETVYIYIPSNMVGAIIGKSGAAIKEMISTSGASIKVTTVPHPSEPQRNDQNQEQTSPKVDEAESSKCSNDEATTNKTAIEEQAQQTSSTSPRVPRYSSASCNPSTTRKVTIFGYPASQYTAQYMIYRKIAMESAKPDVNLTVELSIPSQLVGMIIGKGGVNIKSLQNRTRTTIRLAEDKSDQSQAKINGGDAETCIQITGEFNGSQAAQRHIKGKIRDSSRQVKHQPYRNNESNTVRNNAQNNNHQQSDTGNVLEACDKTIARETPNEKAVTDKPDQESAEKLSQRESPSLSCNTDCHSTKQEDQKSHANSQIFLSTGSDDLGRIRVENESASNNNTMINNLNSAKQQQQHSAKGKKFHTEGVRTNDGDYKEYHLENGESRRTTS